MAGGCGSAWSSPSSTQFSSSCSHCSFSLCGVVGAGGWSNQSLSRLGMASFRGCGGGGVMGGRASPPAPLGKGGWGGFGERVARNQEVVAPAAMLRSTQRERGRGMVWVPRKTKDSCCDQFSILKMVAKANTSRRIILIWDMVFLG